MPQLFNIDDVQNTRTLSWWGKRWERADNTVTDYTVIAQRCATRHLTNATHLRSSFTLKYNGLSYWLDLLGNKGCVLTKLTMDTLGIDYAMKLLGLLRDEDPLSVIISRLEERGRRSQIMRILKWLKWINLQNTPALKTASRALSVVSRLPYFRSLCLATGLFT